MDKSHSPDSCHFMTRLTSLIFLLIPWINGASCQEPVLHLDFDRPIAQAIRSPVDSPGLKPAGHPVINSYAKNASALYLDGKSWLKLADDEQRLAFKDGSKLTIEAWVAPQQLENGQQTYVIGKGRTNNSGFAAENQNYALRIRGVNGLAKISFLFRSIDPGSGKQQYHRWNSRAGFAIDGSWHHIAIEYHFGQPERIAAYLDGKPTGGAWDMGGPTRLAPVSDGDEVWIGSSLGGSRASSFVGWIRDVRIHNRLLASGEIQQRAKKRPEDFPTPVLDDSALANGKVLVEILEQVPERNPPFHSRQAVSESFDADYFGLDRLPRKFVRPGIIADRTPVFLVRARIRKTLRPGKYQFLVRAKSASALLIDNRVVATLPMMKRNASGHEPVPPIKTYTDPAIYPLPPGHQEKIIDVEIGSGPHVVRLETLVGGNGLRNELGECLVAVRPTGQSRFELLSNSTVPRTLTWSDWDRVTDANHKMIGELEKSKRSRLAALDQPFWQKRHAMARQIAYQQVPEIEQISIDSIIEKRLADTGLKPTPLVDDFSFLRRVYLDTIGIPPNRQQIDRFLADQSSDRRKRVIDQLLADDGYADHWVSYWQDVLAENPGILKPKLNNTGPFRFWIHHSLLDNKPLDRFASELIGMKGSRTEGGPAGFAQATQNDVPMAAKANVLARAFLGIDLTCARCHDAPNSHFVQEDLFKMAAMLERKPIVLPKTSSVPNAGSGSAVRVSLKPGQSVAAAWPFTNDLKFQPLIQSDDTRRQLAELITSPDNIRFAQVLANRIWTRMMGQGLLDSPDDFLLGKPVSGELLNYLANYLRANQYDARKLIRLILVSRAYQRSATENEQLIRNFGGRTIRSLTAEQLVDSLFASAGKRMAIGQITFDPEGRRPASTFLNLGRPNRAWELTSLANERDRPALALPRAQSVVDILTAFGWRESRPNPLTERSNDRSLVQPLVLANGDAMHRITELSDDSEFTRIAVSSPTPQLVAERTYLQILGRLPNRDETRVVTEFLAPGFDDRIVPNAPAAPLYRNRFRNAVSWSNHLHPDATRIKQEIEKAVREGDYATNQLKPEWRSRMEDLVWTLYNSPDFILLK